ncbi:MAG: PH domain-containing protein [Bacteroidota bacterium]
MPTIYKSKIDFQFLGLLFLPVFVVAIILTRDWSSFLAWMIVSAVYGAFLYQLCVRTTYTIIENQLEIRLLWATKTIPISTIFHVRKDGYPSAGLRYGFAFKGLIIVQEKGQNMFIAPDREDEFIERLTARLD